MENSLSACNAQAGSPSHGYFPAGKFRYLVSRRHAPTLRSSKYSLLTLLFRLRHPNSKTNQPKFWQIIFLQKLYTFRFLNTKRSKSCESAPHFLTPKNSFAKTSSVFRLATLPRNFLGRTPQKNTLFIRRKRNRARANPKSKELFSFWGCRVK